MADTYIKQPSETRIYSVDFVNLLAGGDSLSAVSSVTATPADELMIGYTSISDATVQFTIGDGDNGTKYKIEVIVTTTNGETLEGDGFLLCKD